MVYFQLYLGDIGQFKLRDGYYFIFQVNKIFWFICGNDYYFDLFRNFKFKIYKIIVKYYYYEGNKIGIEIKKKKFRKEKKYRYVFYILRFLVIL